jgi:hypothetical protein
MQVIPDTPLTIRLKNIWYDLTVHVICCFNTRYRIPKTTQTRYREIIVCDTVSTVLIYTSVLPNIINIIMIVDILNFVITLGSRY